MYVNTYNLDMVPGKHPLFIHITQYEKGLREFTFIPYTSTGTMSYISGALVTLEATKPDGNALVHNCTYNQNGSITYTLQEQLAAKVGKVWSKLVIKKNGNVIATAAIVWVVDPTGVQDSSIISDSDLSGLAGFEQEMISLLGTPIAVSTAAGMTDHESIYLYTGSESGYINGYWYYYSNGSWHAGTRYGGNIPVYTDDGEGNITITIG